MLEFGVEFEMIAQDFVHFLALSITVEVFLFFVFFVFFYLKKNIPGRILSLMFYQQVCLL